MTLDALVGRVVGPAAFCVEAGQVADFVRATGDDAGRWRGFAPPGFAAAALFAVAPALLADPEVGRYGRSLLHAEQAFTWRRALAVGEVLEVRGRVAAVRARGTLHIVSFEVETDGPEGTWMEGVSSFMLSDKPAVASEEEEEPAVDEQGPCDPAGPIPLPAVGEPLPPLRRSASRFDLERYAAAGGDRNPIHWDHDAARAAGLPGVVAHGLLVAAWLFQAAARHRAGPDPLRRARVRFRRPLRPAAAGVISGRVASSGAPGTTLELALEGGAGRPPFATAVVEVTP